MTTRFIAFLRAINVGGRTVKMAELKKLFEAMRLTDVETFIASGNVIFSSKKTDAAKLETLIENGLQRALGYSVDTMLRTVAEVVAIAEHEAFPPEEVGAASLYVGVLKSRPPDAAVAKALALQTVTDRLHFNRGELYWLARKNIAESTISSAAMERAVKIPATFRNINTMRRLAAKYGSG